uniref:Uncharacterized protein n=1 Tax=Rhizophora mucronata TaxID=61149 RepID=A0A2P2PNR9_RHIMU
MITLRPMFFFPLNLFAAKLPLTFGDRNGNLRYILDC